MHGRTAEIGLLLMAGWLTHARGPSLRRRSMDERGSCCSEYWQGGRHPRPLSATERPAARPLMAPVPVRGTLRG
ncbi:hypothetical protein B0T11DRAFT_285577 [Plectosphaerella cucumerina]|uniref:Secreted protein n=1 Tax=Plectosphaerella cucumerina TaxID=40658 RepID=A0A8K0TGB7_9PEZI|nr:hypothetical protein B0T11DRAFT_285577 [Plectosphaerella cucumerina]